MLRFVSSSRLVKLVAVTLVAGTVAVTLFGQSLSLAIQKHDLLDRTTAMVGKTPRSGGSWTATGGSTIHAHPQKNTTAGPTFLFVVGLEGTGHHLFTKIFKGSVHWQKMTAQFRTDLAAVQDLLYGNGGLMSLHCLDQPERNAPNQPPVKTRRDSPVATCRPSDSVCLYNKVVTKLRSVSANFASAPQVIPLNANGNHPTMASYPNNVHRCRSLEYPRLDLFYDVCRDAGIQCGHMYIYRDPSDVVQSTTAKRHYNPGSATAMQLYTTMLDVIFAQFTKYASTNYGCFGFYDETLNPDEQWGPLGELLGWTDRTEFLAHVQKVYRRPGPAKNGTVVVPPRQRRFLDALERSHREVLDLCRRTAATGHA